MASRNNAVPKRDIFKESAFFRNLDGADFFRVLDEAITHIEIDSLNLQCKDKDCTTKVLRGSLCEMHRKKKDAALSKERYHKFGRRKKKRDPEPTLFDLPLNDSHDA
jgi:hypothetical protein